MLLNWDSQIFRTVDDFGWKDEEDKFVRPTQDTKSFTGKVFTKIEWQDFIENQLYNYKSEIFNEETLVQVSSPKNIQKEIRFWVVGGRVVTGSQYRLGNQTIYSDYFEEEAREFAQRMVDKFQLAEAFVIEFSTRRRKSVFQYFPRDSFHKIGDSNGCMTVLFSGPWRRQWKEYINGKIVHYDWGREEQKLTLK